MEVLPFNQNRNHLQHNFFISRLHVFFFFVQSLFFVKEQYLVKFVDLTLKSSIIDESYGKTL